LRNLIGSVWFLSLRSRLGLLFASSVGEGYFCCYWLLPGVDCLAMDNDIDIGKAARQIVETDAFFTGGFVLRGVTDAVVDSSVEVDAGKAAALKGIADEAGKCCGCGLGETRTNVVPGEGNPDARIVFVGEAPGADEDAQGRPFVGRSGKLLGNIIKAMGFRREDVFICNILKCRPPGNRDPKPDEIVKCIPFLHRQLEIIKPEIIVALGAHAAKTLLGSTKSIGQLRGMFHEYYTSEDAEAIKLMPTYHPSYLLRNYSVDNRKRVWEDMKKVLAELGMEMPKGKR